MKNNDRMVCYCKNVTESTIVKAIKEGAHTLKDLQSKTEACTGNQCKTLNPTGKCCSGDLIQLLNRYAPGTIKTENSCCIEK